MACPERDSVVAWIRNNVILVATCVAVVVGLVLGFSVRATDPSPELITWISIWGELFMRMLKMLILPLTVCCLVTGLTSMDAKSGGKLGGCTLAYIFTTHVIAVIIGLVLVFAIKPGASFHDNLPDDFRPQQNAYSDVITDLLRNLVPENIIQACLQTAYTSVSQPPSVNMSQLLRILNDTESGITAGEAVKILAYRDKINIIGIVALSVLLGMVISAAKDAGKPLLDLIVSLEHVVFLIMKLVIWYSPLGICSLLAGTICKLKDILGAVSAVGYFVLTASLGSIMFSLVFLPLLYLAVCRRNPITFLAKNTDAVLAGFAPPTSVACMPYYLKNLPDKFDMDPRVVQFVIPVNVTLNRGGSLLFVTVTTIFCAQSYGISLNTSDIIVLWLLACVMITAVAALPSSSVLIIVMLCSAFNIPTEERLGLIMAVEFMQDRLRTIANVVSHGVGCAILDQVYKRFLKPATEEPEELNEPEELKEPEDKSLLGDQRNGVELITQKYVESV